MIVFGWYGFTIKTIDPSELGLNSTDYESMKFAVRQKVAHIFWIPIFPIGKIYAFESGGQFYHLPASVEDLIKSKYQIRTPFYSFALPLIAALLGLISLIGAGISEVGSYYDRKDQITNKFETIENPNLGDYIEIQTTSYPHFYKHLKVIGTSKDSIEFIVPDTEEDLYFYSLENIEEYYDEHVWEWETVWISKDDLKKAIEDDPWGNSYSFKGTSIAQILGTRKFEIDQIYYVSK